MSRIKLMAQGELGVLSLNSLVKVLTNSLDVLQDLDRRITEQSRGTIEWVIIHVDENDSVSIELDSKIVRGEENRSEQVLELFTGGIDHIKTIGTTPPYFSYESMTKMRNIVRQFGKNGLRGVGYSVTKHNKPILLKPENGKSIENLVGIHHHTLGSVEGFIELISLRRSARHFNVYHYLTQRAIRCSLPREYEGDVFRAAQEHHRIVVTGRISYNIKNEPISINPLKPIRFLKEEELLPSIETMLGRDLDIIGDLCSEDYIRSIRE